MILLSNCAKKMGKKSIDALYYENLITLFGCVS